MRLAARTRALRWIACAALMIALGAACDHKSDTRAEARALLEQLNTLTDQRSLSERQRALQALGRMRLRSPAHAHTRDVCETAQAGLLEAETAQASARRAFVHAKAQADGGTLTTQSAAAVAEEIAHSNRALDEAKARFPACERAMRALLTEAH